MDALTIGLATLATVARVLALIGLSIVTGWGLGYLSVKNRRFENAFVPVVNVLESIPVISFLPVVLIIFIKGLGGSLGVEIAVDFLVFDAVVWNIWIGIYQAFKTVPENLLEVSENYRLGSWSTIRHLYVPHSIPRISSNIFSSFADAMFYISVSEVFSITTQGVPATYSTFGIGTVIALATQAGDFITVYYSLVSIAIAVVVMTALISIFSKRAVAKYGVDTIGEIKHRATHGNRHYGRWLPLHREAEQISRLVPKVRGRVAKRSENSADEEEFAYPNKSSTLVMIGKRIGIFIAIVILAYFLYSAATLAISVPRDQWSNFLSLTPYLLYSMAADYVRVAIITLASMGIAITLGYYMATHRKASSIIAPLLQVYAAFPAPTYFPLVFIATFSFLATALPFGYLEVYVFLLGFVACFYYIFFDFWIGVQAIPQEFWEVMQNHEIGFLTRMRRVILPSTFPYLVTGLSSTINSCWAGLAIGEFWPLIDGKHDLIANVGMMKFIGLNMANGQIANAAWVSVLFAIVVALYGILFTRNLMDLARKKYVVEEGIYAA